MAMAVSVATYNVHDCIGQDRRHDPERVLAVLRELDADLLALQELQWEPQAALDLLQYFAGQLHYRAIPGGTLLRGNGHYGNAILTRLPVRQVRRMDLSVPHREPRGAIEATVDLPSGPLRAVATHLGLWPGERRQQVSRLLARLDGKPGPVLLLGDLNEWFIWGRPLRWLHAHFGHSAHLPTYPACRPLFALDRIWVKPKSLLAELRVHATPLSRAASDHLPLLARLDDGTG